MPRLHEYWNLPAISDDSCRNLATLDKALDLGQGKQVREGIAKILIGVKAGVKFPTFAPQVAPIPPELFVYRP